MSSLYKRFAFTLIVVVLTVALTIFIYHKNKVLKLISLFESPEIRWSVVTPKEEGLNRDVLDKMRTELAERNTTSFLVVRGGRIVYEWYSRLSGPNVLQETASLAKSLTGSIILLSALSEERISLSDPLWKYVPELQNDPQRSKIRIADLISHTSGTDDVNFYQGSIGTLPGWKQSYYDNHSKRFKDALFTAPILFEPGTKRQYSGVAFHSLAYAITVSLKNSEFTDVKSLLRNKVMLPIGIPDSNWNISYGESYKIDGMTLYAIGSAADYTARAMARIGQLLLQRGKWNNNVVIKQNSIDMLLQRDGNSSINNASLYHGWELNITKQSPSLPADAFWGHGGGDRMVLVVPSLDLVAVRTGSRMTRKGENTHAVAESLFFGPLMLSVVGPGSKPH